MESRKTIQKNYRYDPETAAKLEDMAAKAGISESEVVRKLIWEGTVNVYYGHREVLKRLSSIHDSFNQSMLEMRHDGQRLQKSVDDLLEAARSRKDIRIQNVAEKAEAIMDYIAMKCLDKHREAEKEMKDCVDFQCCE